MFSVDTNIVLGIVNTNDRLHNRSVSLLKDEITKNKLIKFATVINESKVTFLRKYNKAFIKLFRIFQEIDKQTDDHIERMVLFGSKFNELREEDKNFMPLVYKLITPFVTKWDIKGAFKFLSQYGLIHSGRIEEILDKEAEYNVKSFDLKLEKEVLREIASITNIISRNVKFKDEPDENIFIEVVLYSIHEKEPLKFYSNDKEFMKTSGIAFSKISEDSTYSNTKINFIHIQT